MTSETEWLFFFWKIYGAFDCTQLREVVGRFSNILLFSYFCCLVHEKVLRKIIRKVWGEVVEKIMQTQGIRALPLSLPFLIHFWATNVRESTCPRDSLFHQSNRPREKKVCMHQWQKSHVVLFRRTIADYIESHSQLKWTRVNADINCSWRNLFLIFIW